MGIQQGSVTLCRYRLVGAGKRHSLAELNGLLEAHKAGPLKLTGIHREEQFGWVLPPGLGEQDLPPDSPWDLSACQTGEGFLLRMRVERRKVPAALKQIVYRQEYFGHLAKAGKAPGPKERREMRDGVARDLTGKALPALGFVDAYWKDVAGELILFSCGRKIRSLFEQLFQLTFAGPLDQTLVPLEAPLMGMARDAFEDSDIARETLGRISLATPALFTAQAYP